MYKASGALENGDERRKAYLQCLSQLRWATLEMQPTRPRHRLNRLLQEPCLSDSKYDQTHYFANPLSGYCQNCLDLALRLVITHHHGLWDIGLDERYRTQREQNLNERRIGLGKLIEIGNKSDSSLGANDLEGVFETDRKTVKGTSKLALLLQFVELPSP